MHEGWSDSNGNLGMAIDFEDAKGLKHYPSISGAYFAAKLGVAEHLFNKQRKAAALVLREIRPEYVMPAGVWQIREGVRQALRGRPNQFDSLKKALDFVCIDSSISSNEWISKSMIYEIMIQQKKITDFIKGNML